MSFISKFFEKSSLRQEKQEHARKNNHHLQRLEKLRRINESPKEKILLLDNIFRAYLTDYFYIGKKDSYEKIFKELKEKREFGLADFSKEMEYYFYGQDNIEREKIDFLITRLESLVIPARVMVVKHEQGRAEEKMPSIHRQRRNRYLIILEKIKKSNKDSKKKFAMLDNLLRIYFANHFSMAKRDSYGEIHKKMKDIGEPGFAEFCIEMESYFYGNAKITKPNIDSLIDKFKYLLNPEINVSSYDEPEKKQRIIKHIETRHRAKPLTRKHLAKHFIRLSKPLKHHKPLEHQINKEHEIKKLNKSSEKSFTGEIKNLFKKSSGKTKKIAVKEHQKKDPEIIKLRKLWYPEEK